VNPSGRLPITFPKDEKQLPNPELPGSEFAKDFPGHDIAKVPFDKSFDVTYPEGADVGYRWYQRMNESPLFAFGHGLSYTRFVYRNLVVKGGDQLRVTCDISNVGAVSGTEVAQVYVRVNGINRLVGWSRIALSPGETQNISVVAEPHLLASFDPNAHDWRIAGGTYSVHVSAAANETVLSVRVRLKEQTIRP
jgi:beta-glucosidase